MIYSFQTNRKMVIINIYQLIEGKKRREEEEIKKRDYFDNTK